MTQRTLSPINLEERPQLVAIDRINCHPGRHEALLQEHWALYLYSYSAEICFNGAPFDVYPGCLTLLPPGTHVTYNLESEGQHIYAHFRLPPPPVESRHDVPFYFDVRGDLYRFEQAFISMGCSFHYRDSPLHSEIKLWDLLLELANSEDKLASLRHPSLEKALQLIDLRLDKEISVSALAHEVGVSRNHLTRLFRTEKDMTVVGYVRQRRAHRAKYLLENTPMSFGAIAAQINSPNLQNFSALLKQETGHPPSFWRRSRDASRSTSVITQSLKVSTALAKTQAT